MEELSRMDTQPTVGTWYENDEGDNFVVVAVHPERGTIEIGTLNGTVDEMDLEEWSEMALQEEWHGSMDDFLAGAKNPNNREPLQIIRRRNRRTR